MSSDSFDCPQPLDGLHLLARGKVRDIYALDDERLLFVATDRLSAFDVVMNNGIPGKGKILTQISMFWFRRLADIAPHHVLSDRVEEMPESVQRHAAVLRGRTLMVRRLRMLPVESIVRG